jgi:hypothetical protein
VSLFTEQNVSLSIFALVTNHAGIGNEAKRHRLYYYNSVVYKQLLDEVYVISKISDVEVSVISRAEGESDNA